MNVDSPRRVSVGILYFLKDGARQPGCTSYLVSVRSAAGQAYAGRPRGDNARLDLYVDDTFIVFKNTFANCRRDFAIVVFLWTALGLPLSLPKADFGQSITWTSGVFTISPTFSSCMKVRLLVQAKPETAAEVLDVTLKLRNTNVVNLKDIRSYAGKCTAVTSAVFTWSPFLRPLWAALTPDVSSRAPKNCIWRKQIDDALLWIRILAS